MTRPSKTRSLLTLAALVAAAVAACRGGVNPEATSHAIAVSACGPADGPAVQIFLANQPISDGAPLAPYVSLYFDRSIEALAPGTYTTSGGTSVVGISRLVRPTSSAIETATSGIVHITSVSADRTIAGDVTATFGTTVFTRGFVAPWLERLALCG